MRKNVQVLVFLAGLGATIANGEPPATKHVDVASIAPRPDDVATIDGMIQAWYDVISGPAGKARDWARDRTLYIPNLRFVSVEVENGQLRPRIRDHQEYVDSSDAALMKGFFEKEIHRVTERFGPIAHVWSTYESRVTENGPVTARGINSIELFWDGKRWWIANGIWTEETRDNPIPRKYLSSSKS